MRLGLAPAALLVCLAMLAFVPPGCKRNSGSSASKSGGASGSPTGGQTVLRPDGGGSGVAGAQAIGVGGGSTSLGGESGSTTVSGGTTSVDGGPTTGGRSGGAGGTEVGLTNTGGTAAAGGGAGGTVMAATGGAVTRTGGTAGTSTSRTGGVVSAGGAAGGMPGTGGSARNGGSTGACPACQAHESCWSDASGSRCIEGFVSVPGAFTIDATEVTRGQYAAWLATHPPTTGQSAVCAWNTTFTPDATCMAKPSVCQGDACATHPQPCVDWCDAAAYCRAIDRRLCTDQDWTNACSSNGAYDNYYGEILVGEPCNANSSSTVPVAHQSGCHPPATSPFTGVFDMIGNLAEWVDACLAATGASDPCGTRGFSFEQIAAARVCSEETYGARSSALDTVGFRCCTP
jgi:sulfatase modifying factor 1